MLDVLGQDPYCPRQGRAAIIGDIEHALRNALIPVVTYIGPLTRIRLPAAWWKPSLPSAAWYQVCYFHQQPRLSGHHGHTIFLAVLMVIMTLISDLMYSAVDPRISFD